MEKTIEIPEGYEARIEGNKVILELKESDDERIRKELIEHIKDQQSSFISAPDCRDRYEEEENDKYNSWIAWLEKQGKEKINEASYRTGIKRVLDNPESYGLAKQCEQNSAWSEEDEANLQFAIDDFQFCVDNNQFPVVYNTEKHKEVLASLKSLKDRVKPQPKSEWSEEDEKMLQGTINSLRKYQLSMPSFKVELQMRWLSSLKNRILGIH